MVIYTVHLSVVCVCVCMHVYVNVWTLTGLDFQNTSTPHSNQPMDTLVHSQQQDAQHQSTDSSPAAVSKVCSYHCSCTLIIASAVILSWGYWWREAWLPSPQVQPGAYNGQRPGWKTSRGTGGVLLLCMWRWCTVGRSPWVNQVHGTWISQISVLSIYPRSLFECVCCKLLFLFKHILSCYVFCFIFVCVLAVLV